jgi:formyl-CoA transferase/CoA:oxalate CoA-transferase
MVMALAWGVDNQWALYCSAIDRVELIDDPRFDTSFKRTENHAELEPILFAAMAGKTTDEWLAILEPYGMPIGPLNSIGEAMSQEQIVHRGMITEVDHPEVGTIKMADSPLKHMSRTPAGAGEAGPAFAQDTAAVLQELLGYDAAQVEELVEAGVALTEGGPDIEAYLNA